MTGHGEFTCSKCRGVFEKAWPDEEAMAEARQLWGNPPEGFELVCDDCFIEVMEQAAVSLSSAPGEG